MMSRPARSWSRIASSVASSCACSRYSGSTRHSSLARTRGGKRPRELRSRSISQSGWAYEPTRLVGRASGSEVPDMPANIHPVGSSVRLRGRSVDPDQHGLALIGRRLARRLRRGRCGRVHRQQQSRHNGDHGQHHREPERRPEGRCERLGDHRALRVGEHLGGAESAGGATRGRARTGCPRCCPAASPRGWPCRSSRRRAG